MIAPIERPDGDHLQDHAGNERCNEPEREPSNEAVGQRHEGRGEIGAEHVKRSVRQIDEIHDAEDQRQAGRQQEQQHAELNAVQALFNEIKHGNPAHK